MGSLSVMNILMLNYEYPPMGGGAGNATCNIAKELVRMGHNVTVLTSNVGGQPKEEIQDGVRILRVFSWRKGIHDCGLRGAYSYLIAAAIKLIQLRRQHSFDILHYFFGLPTGLLSFLPWAYRKTPYIVSLRGSDVPYYDIFSRNVHLLNLLLRPITRSIWRGAAKVVALSDNLQQTALRTAPSHKIEVIPNGVEADLFSPPAVPPETSGRLSLLTVSRLINRKGIDHILAALARLGDPQIELHIVGTGNCEAPLKALCTQLGLDKAVTFHGYHPRKELPHFYNQADVFILPSLAESFGLAFAEAMACGLPIIGTRTGGITDLVKEDNGILVEPANVEELCQAIIHMKEEPAMRAAMAQANRQRILAHYTWGAMARSYLAFYRDVVAAPNKAAKGLGNDAW